MNIIFKFIKNIKTTYCFLVAKIKNYWIKSRIPLNYLHKFNAISKIKFCLQIFNTVINLYIALFTIALARYELALFLLDNKVSNLITLTTGQNPKMALERIPYLQHRKVPVEPHFFNPISIFYSLNIKYHDHNPETVSELRALVTYYKKNLTNINLNGVILQGSGKLGMDYHFNNSKFINVFLNRANLNYNSFISSKFIGVDFWGAKMLGTDFKLTIFTNSKIDAADFSGSNLCGAQFIDTNYDTSIFRGANLIGVDLSHLHIPEFSKSQNFYHAYYNSEHIITTEATQFQFLNFFFPSCIDLVNIPPTKFPKDFNPKLHGMVDISNNEEMHGIMIELQH